MESKKIHLFEGLIDKEVFMIENEMSAIMETSKALLKSKDYNRYLKNAEKLVQMSKSIDYLNEFRDEVIDMVKPSELRPPPTIDKGYVNKEANYMEGLIKAVTDLAEEKPREEPKKKVGGGLGDLAKSFEGVGNNNIPRTNAKTHTGEDGEVYETYGA